MGEGRTLGYEVVRVLNNNAVLATDRVGGQVVLLGRGIGFGAHLGDPVDAAAASQVFVPDQAHSVSRLVAFVSEAPMEVMTVAAKLAEQAARTAGVRATQALVLALADHLQFAADRARQGIEIEYPLRWEVAQLYPKEYALGREAVAVASNELGVDLAPGEATAFALHLVNAQSASGDLSATEETTTRLLQVLRTVTNYLRIDVPDDSMAMARFVTHLRYLFVRLQSNDLIDESPAGLVESVQAGAPDAFRAAEKVRALLEMNGSHLTRAELAYLALHIARLAGEVPTSGTQASA